MRPTIFPLLAGWLGMVFGKPDLRTHDDRVRPAGWLPFRARGMGRMPAGRITEPSTRKTRHTTAGTAVFLFLGPPTHPPLKAVPRSNRTNTHPPRPTPFPAAQDSS